MSQSGLFVDGGTGGPADTPNVKLLSDGKPEEFTEFTVQVNAEPVSRPSWLPVG